uniref:ATP synthase F0 subunit 6 n=1 Tax=Centrotypus laticornis TaxID=2980484 RepID=UPI0028FCE782|nr:ATP synthase F0 subunit 6 [Centrotypus laticornis]UXF57635.1 ATP synthase F0 subunit 6 [Centrotypus laticornis]
MMNNLFSTFDPSTGMMSLNWISSLMFITTMNYNYWMNPNNINNLTLTMMMMMKKEMNMIMDLKGTHILNMSLGLFILTNNMTGLIPYVFTSSSHMLFSLSMALPMWTALMLYGWMNKTNKMLSHLVPTGTPPILMPFMVMIETISNLIRPGSLAVRLTANMIAGHLLMSLLGNNCTMMMTIMAMFMFVTLMMFEMAVSMIQSYVFMTLMTLYSSEI